jgi:hypothetical protein
MHITPVAGLRKDAYPAFFEETTTWKISNRLNRDKFFTKLEKFHKFVLTQSVIFHIFCCHENDVMQGCLTLIGRAFGRLWSLTCGLRSVFNVRKQKEHSENSRERNGIFSPLLIRYFTSGDGVSPPVQRIVPTVFFHKIG